MCGLHRLMTHTVVTTYSAGKSDIYSADILRKLVAEC